jgi:multidrug efflux pump subunit AcrB
MTLLGLSLAIGLLIDDAVVVRENIFKHLERGVPPAQAALDGTREISLAVLATTLTIVAVFVPVAFMEGMVGQFFKQFGLTVSAAVLVSLFVAFTLDPMLSSRFSKPFDPTRPERFVALKRPFRAFFKALDAGYRDLLGWSVGHKALVGLFCGFALLGMVALLGVTGADFVEQQDRGQFNVGIELPAGTSLDETTRLSRQASAELRRSSVIKTVLETAGAQGDANRIQWRVLTVPKGARTTKLSEIQDSTRAIASALPGAKVVIADVQMIEGAGFQAPIVLNIRGASYDSLAAIAGEVASVLRSIPGLTDVDTKYSPGRSELRVALDRERAADQGLSVAQVAMTRSRSACACDPRIARQRAASYPSA